MIEVLICPYCGKPAELVNGSRLFPHRRDLNKEMCASNFWLCIRCDAYVGCHKPNERYGLNGTEPLGTMANENLRTLRVKLHKRFDSLWLSGEMNRTEAYRLMAQVLGVSIDKCHIGMFDEETCRKALEIFNE